jgi:hypothetical protein
MQPEVTLRFRDQYGREQRALVRSMRFSIGRSPDNDLVIDESRLSRRHAIIESYDGLVQISDCGSQNGTLVNGNPVVGAALLRHGDVITLGSACDIIVEVASGAPAGSNRSALAPGAATTHSLPSPVAPGPNNGFTLPAWLLSTPFIAAASMVAIIIVAGAIMLALSGGPGKSRNVIIDEPTLEPSAEETETPEMTETPGAQMTPTVEATPGGLAPTSAAQIENFAKLALARISLDDKPYEFPSEAALRDVMRKIEQYRGQPAVRGALQSLQRSGPELSALARDNGLEPGLLMYAALAQTDGGRAGDPVAAARQMAADLSALGKIFGTSNTDSCLILVAAYKMEGWTKKTHPLLATMRRLVNNPLTERNIWHLRSRGGLNDQAYDFALRFIALGIVAQAPNQFGVGTAPLTF